MPRCQPEAAQHNKDVWKGFLSLSLKRLINLVGCEREAVSGSKPHPGLCLLERAAVILDVDSKDRLSVAVEDTIIGIRAAQPMVLDNEATCNQFFFLALETLFSQSPQ